jgi:hypothetical protein
VGPNVAKAHKVVTLGQTIFGLVSPYLDNYIAEVGDFEDFLGFLVSHQGDKEDGKRYESVSSCRRRAFCRHLLDDDVFVAQLLE